jgi:hypothetical protein
MQNQPAHLFHAVLPGAMLLGALVFAPWFWGCTWPLGIGVLTDFLFLMVAAWSAGVLWRGVKLNLPVQLVVVVLGLLAQGWWMALNGHTNCDRESGLLLPVAGHIAWLPGSADQGRSREDMARLSGLLGAGIISAWLGETRFWRRSILWTLALTGMSIALLGCVERLTKAPDIFWNSARHLDFFFATFRNVTNAGEYLNFVLPVAAGLVLFAARAGGRPWKLAAAPLVMCGSMALFLAMNRGDIAAGRQRVSGKARLATLIILVVALGVIVESVGVGTTWERWARVMTDRNGEATWSNRLAVDRVCVLALPDAGALGFGPGTFRAMFPYYSGRVPVDLAGVWTYAHDDYAQTGLEWGWMGGVLWSVYFFGGMLVLGRGWFRREWKMEDRIYGAGLLVALGAMAVMAAVDFPLQIASIQLCVAAALGLAWSSPTWPRIQP